MKNTRRFFKRRSGSANKSLAVLAVLAVVLFWIGAGLAVIPHAHGSDFNHSEHKTCPVYQLSLHSADMLFIGAAFLAVSFTVLFFLNESFKSFSSFFVHYFHLRAPPALI